MPKCLSSCSKLPRDLCIKDECQYFNGDKKKYCRLSNKYKMDEHCVPFMKPKTEKRKKKCYSKCRKIPEELCTNECTFIKGKKYNFCRLSNKYTMDEECTIRPKTKKANTFFNSEQNNSMKQKNAITNSIKKNAITNSTKKNAMKKIYQFMTRVDSNKRRAHFLKAICSHAGICMAFGKEIDKIRKHFDGFMNFSYVKQPIKQIGEVSANGFVNEITYEKNGYVSNSILKSAIRKDSDNLMFEYIVGKYINKQCKIFSCFIETYGIFTYNNVDVWKNIKNNKNLGIHQLKHSLTLLPQTITTKELELSCKSSNYLALLIQHIHDAKSLHQMCKDPFFLEKDIVNVLYQIYLPLATLANTFTHYDLHKKNILVYEPIKNKYMNYKYYLNDGSLVEFKSSYIAKIIDYGRCFFVDKDETDFIMSSKTTYDAVCKIKKCDPKCGKNVGYKFMQKERTPGSNAFISSIVCNRSHDLRLLNELYITKKIDIYNPSLYDLLQKVKYGVGIHDPEEKIYGTKEQLNSEMPHSIVNIGDAHEALKHMVISNKIKNDNDYKHMESVGTFHIYQNGTSMNFIPNVHNVSR